MSADLKSAVHAWLIKTGLPLEMAAADAFRQAGFEVRQSSTYADPVTGKGREIDVLAGFPDFIGFSDISFILECKSGSKPWVVLTSGDALANTNAVFVWAYMSKKARLILHDNWPELDKMRYLKRPVEGGYGFRQVEAKNDPAYDAAMQVSSACASVFRPVELEQGLRRMSVAFPVIVVDTPLFECRLLPDGKLDLSEVEQSEFLFAADVRGGSGCRIKVVTKGNLPKFASDAYALARELRIKFEPEERKLLAELEAKSGLHELPPVTERDKSSW